MSDLKALGFNGMPVLRGTGIKVPLVNQEGIKGAKYLNPQDKSSAVENGLITLFDEPEEACRTLAIIGWKSEKITEKLADLLEADFATAAEAVFALKKHGECIELTRKLSSSERAKKAFHMFGGNNV